MKVDTGESGSDPNKGSDEEDKSGNVTGTFYSIKY